MATKKKGRPTKDSIRKSNALEKSRLEEADEEENWSPSSLISDALKSDLDPGIFSVLNEGDIPKAANFAEFCLNKNFLNVVPYPRQIEVGLSLFGDVCFDCSNPAWMPLNLFDQPIAEILDNVQFLEFGQCPKCKKTRLDFYKEDKFHYPQELAGVAGQRCVTGDTLILSDSGLVEIKDYRIGDRVSNGSHQVYVSDFFSVSPEEIFRVELSNGHCVRGTADHPLLTHKGFTRLGDLKPGDTLPIEFGTFVFGNCVPSFDDLSAYVQLDFDRRVAASSRIKWRFVHHKLPTGTMQLCDARFLGLYIAEGDKGGVTNYDATIRNFCKEVLCRWFGEDVVYEEMDRSKVAIRTSKSHMFFDALLGYPCFNTSAFKRIPLSIRRAPAEYISAFLQGLYDGDGTVEWDCISYDTISRQLAVDVSLLLQNFGIPSKIRKSYKKATNGTPQQIPVLAYRVEISGPTSITAFKKYVGFSLPYKNSAILSIEKRIHNRTLDMPFWYEKLSTIQKSDFIDLVVSIQKQLHASSDGGRKFGIQSVLGINTTDCFRRMRKSHNVALSKKKIERILTPFTDYSHLFDNETTNRIKQFLDLSRSSESFVTIKSIHKDAPEQTYDFTIPDGHRFWTNGLVSHNSGKSSVVAMLAAYQLHRYLSIPDPVRYFGLLPASRLFMTMTAVSAMQAEALLWAPFKEYADESPWFSEYHRRLVEVGERQGVELLHRPKTFLVYKHKKLACLYEAPNKRRLRGKTRFFCTVDELSWLESDANKESVTLSADEISAALDNSLRTLRAKSDTKKFMHGLYNAPDALSCNVSSPSAKDDKLMRNLRAAKTNKRIYGFHFPTWEFNPEITRESLQSEFDKSQRVAERDFGAVPPLANDPFIENPNCIDMMIREEHKHSLLQVKIAYTKDDFGNVTKHAEVRTHFIDKRKPRMLLIDAGEKRNHFAIMLMSFDTKMNRPKVDYVFDVAPEEGIPINYPMMWEKCFQPICQNLLIRHMFSDTWNSTDIIQRMRQFKIMSDQITLKYSDFQEIASRLNSSELILPKPENTLQELKLTYEDPVEYVKNKPILSLILQMLTVRQVGRRITKPLNGNDDMFRALCLGMNQIVQPELKRIYAIDAAGGSSNKLGTVLQRSSGVGQNSKKITNVGSIQTKRDFRGR